MKPLTIRSILMLSLGAMAGVGVVSNAGGFLASHSLSNELSEANDNTIPSLLALSDIAIEVNDTRNMLGLAILEDRAEQSAALARELEQRLGHVSHSIDGYEHLVSDPRERTLLEAVNTAWIAYAEDARQILANVEHANDDAATALFIGDADESGDAVVAAIDAQIKYNKELATTGNLRGDAAATVSVFTAIGLGLGALLISGAVLWILTRRVLRPIAGLTAQMGELASGNNTIAVDGLTKQDEVGDMARALDVFRKNALERIALEARAEREKAEAEERRIQSEKAAQAAAEQLVTASFGEGMKRLAAGDLTYRLTGDIPDAYRQLQADFNDALAKLSAALASVLGSTDTIKDNSGEVASAADQLSQRTEQQAASLEQTAAALEQVTATVKKSAEGAANAGVIVQHARAEAAQSGEVVAKAVAAMGAIEQSAAKIAQIIGVIDEIAFQTNLLALNAGVEAARAGETGRGFAVVASEVRALAQRSAEAAKEIKTLISASVSEVTEGARLVDSTGEALHKIIEQVSRAHGAVHEIVASAQEQSTALQQVNVAINQLDQMTQQNAAMVEENSAASQSLANEADKLAGLASSFKVGPLMRTSALPAARSSKPASLHVRGAAALAADEWEEF